MWFVLMAALLGGDDPKRILSEVEALIASGEMEKAALALRSRLEGPGRIEAFARHGGVWALLGRAARGSGDYETSAAAFSQAFALSGDLGAALSSAECYLEMKDPDGAESVLEKLPKDLDREAVALVDELRGMAFFLKNKEAEARPFLERAHAAGRMAPSHFLGLERFHRGDYQEALRFFEEAIKGQADDYYSRLYRAWAFLNLNRIDEARKALEEMRTMTPTPEVEDMLGRVEVRAERFDAALVHFRAALEGSPGYAEAQSGVATALRRLGKKEEARAATETFRKLFQAQQEDLKVAYALTQKHLASPKDPEIAEELVRHFWKTGDLQESERYAWKVLTIDSGRIYSRLTLARSLAAIGRYRDAAFQYKKILRAQSDHPEARAELENLIRRHARRRTGSDG